MVEYIDLKEYGYYFNIENRVWTRKEIASDFSYSDGDSIEEEIYKNVKDTHDISVHSQELASKINNWPSLYHLSYRRSNLLKGIEHTIGKKVLEIGAGCGALTRFLGEKGCEVWAIEGSERRARIARERCRDLSNVTVIADNIQNIEFYNNFDTIILVGVLEYSRLYFSTEHGHDPVDAVLSHIRKFMKSDANLIIAIENQLGLKYFAGHPEDHFGQKFFGIEDRYNGNSIVTFGRIELFEKIKSAGFKFQNWYYPFPDYKLPLAIMSEKIEHIERFDKFKSLIEFLLYESSDDHAEQIFDVKKAWYPIVRNRLLNVFANSYLIVASDQNVEENILAQYFGQHRLPPYRKMLSVIEDGMIAKTKTVKLDRNQLQIGETDILFNESEDVFFEGCLWQQKLTNTIKENGWSTDFFNEWVRRWWYALADDIQRNEGSYENSSRSMVGGQYFDYIPKNLMINQADYKFIDKEFSIKGEIPVGYVFFRGLLDTIFSIEKMGFSADIPNSNIIEFVIATAQNLDLEIEPTQCESYWELETKFQGIISGATTMDFQTLSKYRIRGSHSGNDNKEKAETVQIEESIRIDEPAIDIADFKRIMIDAKKSMEKIEAIADILIQNDLSRFDPDWYIATYEDVKASGMDPLVHYIRHGRQEGRKKHG
ncbi:class I SAM-dependent methyltransferase [Methylobacterium indicum]|uniref:class I SAM-dependent methyltransferase n=1 Tax=Methylobacterium indicum TaxID=1775910 RepID=UPI0009E5C6DD|nr:class I SAM-dependent methyltransferase [Methylobacterium indicum]